MNDEPSDFVIHLNTAYEQTLRNPWWRYTRYLRLWLITMIVAAGIGWMSGGWNGVVVTCLGSSALQAVLFPMWEHGERRKDREYWGHTDWDGPA